MVVPLNLIPEAVEIADDWNENTSMRRGRSEHGGSENCKRTGEKKWVIVDRHGVVEIILAVNLKMVGRTGSPLPTG